MCISSRVVNVDREGSLDQMAPMTTRRVAMLGALAALLIAGCGGGHSDRTGGAQARKPHVLTIAIAGGSGPDLDAFAHEVAQLSGGTLRVDVRDSWRHGQAASEIGMIGDVRKGEADLGAAGSRSWDSVGVQSLRALHAPLLINSYALEERVLEDPIAKTMLRGVAAAGVEPLGILPGPMRKPLGISKPLVAPGDYRGLTIGVGQSRVGDATMRALGARPVWLPIGASIAGLGGIEAHVGSIEGNRYGRIGRYLTANVDLWPRPMVVFANRAALSRLSPQQQNALRRAIPKIVPAEIERLRREERDAAGVLCRSGERFVSASPQDIAALRRAVQPVYDELSRDPQTRRFLEQIERMRASAPSVSDPLSCAGTQATALHPSPLDGVWRMKTTAKDHAAGEPDSSPSNYGLWTYVFDRGRFAITQEDQKACTWGYGTLKVSGNHFAWTFKDGGGISPDHATNLPGEFFVFAWSRFHDTLTVSPVRGQVSPENFLAKPWRRVSATPSPRYLAKRCPPPAGSLPG
jgi:TRAP-type transport system periplasmic protein